MQYQSVSKTGNAYSRSDQLELAAEAGVPQAAASGSAYRYEYEYERSSFEIFTPGPGFFAPEDSDVLAQAVGGDIAQQFLLLAETDTIRTYENRVTHRYIHIDGVTGQFCDQQRNPISVQHALAYALPSTEALPPRFGFTITSLDLQLGTFLRRSADFADDESLPSRSIEPEEPEPGRPKGVLRQIRQLIATKFRSADTSENVGTPVTRERAGLSLREPDRDLVREEFSLAAFTRRVA